MEQDVKIKPWALKSLIDFNIHFLNVKLSGINDIYTCIANQKFTPKTSS